MYVTAKKARIKDFGNIQAFATNESLFLYGTDALNKFSAEFAGAILSSKEVERVKTSERTETMETSQQAPTTEAVQDFIELKDGNFYSTGQINSAMLKSMGYTELEIGAIYQKIC